MIKPKLFYTIGEVARMLDEPISTIRHWEKLMPELRPGTSRRGTRLYKQGDIDRLMSLRILLREQGLTIEGAKRMMTTHGSGVENRAKALILLRNVRSQLYDLRKALDQTERKSMLSRIAGELQLEGLLDTEDEQI